MNQKLSNSNSLNWMILLMIILQFCHSLKCEQQIDQEVVGYTISSPINDMISIGNSIYLLINKSILKTDSDLKILWSMSYDYTDLDF